MSDGPHKTLPLGQHWNRVLKKLGISVYQPEEVTVFFREALVTDWYKEVPEKLPNILYTMLQKPPLHPEILLQELQALIDQFESTELLKIFVEHLEYHLQNQPGERGHVAAIQDTLIEWLQRRVRQLKESIANENNKIQKRILNQRMTEALAILDVYELARQLKHQKKTARKSKRRKDRIDDGVSI